MVTRIRRWGNSQGIRISKQLLATAAIAVGDEIEVAVQDGTIVLRPLRRVRGRYDLRDLVEDIPDGQAGGEIDWGPPVGREVW